MTVFFEVWAGLTAVNNESSSTKRKSDVSRAPSHILSGPVCGGTETTETIQRREAETPGATSGLWTYISSKDEDLSQRHSTPVPHARGGGSFHSACSSARRVNNG